MDDPKVIAAIVASITSLIVTLLTLATRNPLEKRIILFKVDLEHLYEQKKAIRDSVTNRKQQLLTFAIQLNDRLANFSQNYSKGWLNVDGWGDYLHRKQNGNFTHPYIISFVYRIGVLYALIWGLEKSVVHFDTESASEKDMALLSYVSIFQHVFTDCHISVGIEQEHTLESRPHLSNTELRRLAEYCMDDGNVIDYDVFIKKAQEDFTPVLPLFVFLNGVNPESDAELKAQRLQLLHLVLMCFVADFGYAHQSLEATNVEKWVKKYSNNRLFGYLTEVYKRAGVHTKPSWLGGCKTHTCRLVKLVSSQDGYCEQLRAERNRFSWKMAK